MIYNKFYKSSVEHSPVGIIYNKIIYDDKGNPQDYQVVEINKCFESILGLEEKEVVGRTISQLYEETSEEVWNWKDFYANVIATYKKDISEYSYVFADKHYRVKSHSPNEGYVIIYLVDISAEAQKAEALNVISDNVPIQMWYLNDAYTYVSGNKAHADFMGLKKEQLAYKDVRELFSPEEAHICIIGNKKVFKEKKKMVVKSWLHNHQGEKRLLKINKNPQLDSNGQVEFVICSAEDITDQYISEDQNKIKEKILYSTIDFTQELLTNHNHYSALSNGIEMLGNATNVDRVYYWENHYHEASDQWLSSQKFEWCLGDIDQQIDNPQLQNIPFSEAGELIEILSQNKPFNTHIKDMDETNKETKQILQAQGILSILIIPVFVKDQFKGFVGFDSCRVEKEWSYVEISVLNSFVLLYAKALEKDYLEKQVLQANKNFNNFFNMSQDLLFVLDYVGNIIDINDSVLKKLNYRKCDLIGNSVLMLHPKDQAMAAQKNIADLVAGEIEYCDILAMKSTGETFPVETRVTEGIWNGEKALFCSSQDITERSKYEEHMRAMSNRDGLTGIYNRRYIYEWAEKVIESYKQKKDIFCVSIIDLDDFKHINDTYGHHVGDFILVEFTKVVSANLPPQDILARYGGEEFIIIHGQTDRTKAEKLLHNILHSVRSESFIFNEYEIGVTFSAGISSCEELGEDQMMIDQLIQIADKRMYYAKETGKNKIISKGNYSIY